MSNERRRGFLRVSEHQAQELERWAYPDYSDETDFPTDNALNYDPQWQNVESLEEEEEQSPPPLTAADLEEIRASAYEEGFTEGHEAGHSEGLAKGFTEGTQQGTQQGLEQGLAQGLEQGQEQINEQVGFLTQLVDKIAMPLEQVDGEVEQQLLRLVTGLTRELIQVELKTNSQVILNTLRETVSALPIAGQAVIIQLQPDDLELVKHAYGEENLDDRQWTLQAEPAMNRGDIYVQSGESTVDFRMEERIRYQLEQFSGLNRQQPTGEP